MKEGSRATTRKSSGRVRKVIRRGSKRTTGKFPTLKPKKRSVHWESPLERDFLFLLEIDRDVISYREQPLKIKYVLDGKEHLYTPDYLVERVNKKQLIEVKPKEKVQKYELIFRTVSSICERNGYEFVVVTEEQIRVQPRLNNIKFLWRYSRTQITPQHQIACYEFFKNKKETTLDKVMDFFATTGIGKQVVYGLLYQGILEFDLNKRIDSGMAVRFPGATGDAGKES